LSKRILYIIYSNPAVYPPLEHSSRIFADAGWDVLFLGARVIGNERLQFKPHPKIAVWAFPPATSGGLWLKCHYALFVLWTIVRAVLWRPDWVYASDLWSTLPAWLLKKAGFRILYHEHDPPQTDGRSISWTKRIVFRARRAIARDSALCVLPGSGRADVFRRETGTDRPVTVVWNVPSVTEISSARPMEGARGDLVLVYHGSLAPSRLPITLIEAVLRLDGVRLHATGYEVPGHRGYADHIKRIVADRRREGSVMFHDPMPRHELMLHGPTGHVGISLLPREMADPDFPSMLGPSNKPFDYMSLGMALLVTDLPDWKEVFVDGGYGMACDPSSVESVQAVLRWFLENPDRTRQMGELGRERILDEWNYEKAFGKALAAIERGPA